MFGEKFHKWQDRNFINGKIEEEKDILFDDISASFNLYKKNYSVSAD
jgi:hypothetical protein